MSFAAPNDEKRQQAYVSCSILSGWMSFAAKKVFNIANNAVFLQYPQRMDELCSTHI